MTLFNEFNSRKLQTVDRLKSTFSEWNAFEGILNNPVFCAVVGTTFVLQIVLVEFGGLAVSVTSLDINQWTWCILLGVGSLPMQFVVNGVLLLTNDFFPPEALPAAIDLPAGSGLASQMCFNGQALQDGNTEGQVRKWSHDAEKRSRGSVTAADFAAAPKQSVISRMRTRSSSSETGTELGPTNGAITRRTIPAEELI